MGKNKLKPPARTWRKVSLQITSIQDQAVGLACRWHHCWGYKRRTCRIAGTTRRWKTKHQRGHRSEMVTGWECRPPPLPFWSTREKEAFHYTRSSSIKDERPASLAVFMKHSISHILYCSPIALHGFLSSLSLVGTFISSSMRRHPQCIKFDPEALHLCDWLTAVPSTTRHGCFLKLLHKPNNAGWNKVRDNWTKAYPPRRHEQTRKIQQEAAVTYICLFFYFAYGINNGLSTL